MRTVGASASQCTLARASVADYWLNVNVLGPLYPYCDSLGAQAPGQEKPLMERLQGERGDRHLQPRRCCIPASDDTAPLDSSPRHFSRAMTAPIGRAKEGRSSCTDAMTTIFLTLSLGLSVLIHCRGGPPKCMHCRVQGAMCRTCFA